MEEIIFLKIPV